MIGVKELKKGSYMMHKGEPALVKFAGLVVTGTHCHSKMKLDVQGLFSGTNDSFTLSLQDRVEEVDIKRKHGQVLSASGRQAQVMDMQSYESFDAAVEEGIEVREGDNVTFIDYKGRARIVDKRG